MRHFVALLILLLIFPSFVCVSMAGEEVTSSNLYSILHEIDTTTDSAKKIKLITDLRDALGDSSINYPTFQVDISNTMIRVLNNDKDPDVLTSAVTILSYDDNPFLIPLFQRLIDTDPAVAQRAQEAIDDIKKNDYNRLRPFEEVKADLFKKDTQDEAIRILIKYHQNDPRAMNTLMGIIKGENGDLDLQTFIIRNFGRSKYFKDHQAELDQISHSLLFNKDLPLTYRRRMLQVVEWPDNNDILLKIINNTQESKDMRWLALMVLNDRIRSDPSSLELFKRLKEQFEQEGNMILLGEVNKCLKYIEFVHSSKLPIPERSSNTQEIENEDEEEEKKSMDENPVVSPERITKEAVLSCIGGMTGASESHFKKMAENASEITERLESSSPEENQRKNDANDRELIRIENRLKNALERLEMDTDTYQVAVEPIEKDIRQLNNEINGPFPGTLKRAATEVAEVFGYNEFGTHESRRFEIRKKEFEIRKKEKEILGSAVDELRDAYDEARRFFNANLSVQKKSFPGQIILTDRELLTQSREMLSEFSNFRSSQKK